MSYLRGKVSDKFSFLHTEPVLEKSGERTKLVLSAERKYCPYIRQYTEERIAEIIAIGYKYLYFQSRLLLPYLTPPEREILLTALVAADLPEDREYVRTRLTGEEVYCIDGTYRFRLHGLKNRWKKISEYVSVDFNALSLDSFLSFLTGEGEGKFFLKDGKLYDEDYRLLNKSVLTGRYFPIGEILLSGAKNVYAFGKPSAETENFLKKYYKERAVFC